MPTFQRNRQIIAMTANAMQGDNEECLKAGMDDCIAKPIKLQDLVQTIEKWALLASIRPRLVL